MREGGFVQVSQVIKLMTVHLFHLPSFLSRPLVRMLRIDRASGVKVTVRLLGRADLRDQAVEIRFELRVGAHAERVRSSFEHFVDVGVVEGVAGRLLVLKLLAAERGGGALEVINALRLLALLECEWNRHCPVDLDARRPEDVVEMYGSERHRFDGVITRRFCWGRFVALRDGRRGSPEAERRGNTKNEPFPSSFHS